MKTKEIGNLIWGVILLMSSSPISVAVFSQNDTTFYEEIKVIGQHRKIDEHTTLKKKEIEKLAPEDVGTLLQYINGVTVKNYGGVGGMKTLSYRGMGGEHTRLIIDDAPIINPQTGLVNFGNLSPNTVEEVKLINANSTQLIPVSAQIMGSTVLLKTFDQTFSKIPFSLKTDFSSGSFGLKEGALSMKKAGNNGFISASGSFRTYKGNFPYRLPFEENSHDFYRKNNALNEFHASVGGGIRWGKDTKHHLLKIYGKMYGINQELAGAVILYNELTQSSLSTKNGVSGIAYDFHHERVKVKVFGQFMHHDLHYKDPNFLNQEGGLDNRYKTNVTSAGFVGEYRWKHFDLSMGNDFSYDQLKSSRELGNPARFSNTAMTKLAYKTKFIIAEAGVFLQNIYDNNELQSHRNGYYKIHPHLTVSTSDEFLRNTKFFAWYKPSSRAPSFNDLYYSQVGNKELFPEEAFQINVGAQYVYAIGTFEGEGQVNVFKNSVKNKILALPTKNLFIWSIQNIGKVDIYGGDIHLKGKVQFNKNWSIHLQTGWSYQKALDIGDEYSPSYKHQIAYTPEWFGNFMISGYYKTIGLHFNGLYVGKRYSLNENIESNRLNPYTVTHVSISYNYSIKEEHLLKINVGIKNVLNESYDFIRYFVMPGRNYFIKLSYEFNGVKKQ